jgi:hypothetical protein
MSNTINEESTIQQIPLADQCTIQFRDINFSVALKGKEKKDKVILQNVSGFFKPGR